MIRRETILFILGYIHGVFYHINWPKAKSSFIWWIMCQLMYWCYMLKGNGERLNSVSSFFSSSQAAFCFSLHIYAHIHMKCNILCNFSPTKVSTLSPRWVNVDSVTQQTMCISSHKESDSHSKCKVCLSPLSCLFLLSFPPESTLFSQTHTHFNWMSDKIQVKSKFDQLTHATY